MIGSQLYYYILAEDIALLEAAWRKRGPFVAASGFDPDGTVHVIDTLQVQHMGHELLGVYLVPPWLGLRSAYFSEKVRGSPHIDPWEVPVVEFDRCYCDGHILRRGRLYAAPSAWAPLVGNEAEVKRFRSWLRGLYAVARKNLIRWDGMEYIGPHALNEVTAGKLQLTSM